MVLTWISEKGAKWVVYIFGAGILVGLLSLGQTNLDHDRMPPVATVDGTPISLAQFRQAYDGALAQYSSQNLTEENRAEIRNQVLDQLIRSHLTRQQMDAAKIRATVNEMKHDLLNNPPEEWKSAEIFLTDSVFDESKWRQFVSSDSIYDQSFMLGYENYLKLEKIPSQQLQIFVAAGYHATDAEAELALLRRENRMDVEVVVAPIEAFELDPASITEEELKAAYQAQPDSFWAPARMAQFEIAALEVTPSQVDEEDGKGMLEWIMGQMDGEFGFEEMAQSHSADEGSAANGGSLGGFQPYDRWVPEFAAVARTLDSGAVSAPVRTPFGWHLIRCNGKRVTDDGVEEADLSHILVKVVAGNKTLDSLRRVVQSVSDAVVEKKIPFAKAAEEAGLKWIETGWLQRGEGITDLGTIPGLASYGFADKIKGKVSKIIENDRWMVLANRTALLEAGERDFSLAERPLRQRLLEEKKLAAATAYLTAAVAGWNGVVDSAVVAEDEKLRWSSASQIGVDGYLPGLGMASSVLVSLSKGAEGVWSAPLQGERAAVVGRVSNRVAASPEVVAQALPQEVGGAAYAGAASLVNDWIRSLENGVKVERNLDLYFQE